jgi:hypothetical protein
LKKSIHNQVLTEILKGRKGKLIFPSDFKDMANTDAIRQTLSRLAREGILKRVAHGIYLYPKEDSILGILYPSTDEIAQAIAKRDKIRIMPTSLNALNKLGLSTQVPMKMGYLTDGKPKTIKAGKRTITFKTTTPKKLSAKGKISGLVIRALEELGKDAITADVINRITDALQKEDRKIIKEDAKLAPEWIAQLLFSIADKMKDHD